MPQQQPPDDLFEAPTDLFSEPDKPKANQGFVDSVSQYIPESVKTGWQFANKPLVDYIPGVKEGFDPHAAADFYDVPREEDWTIPLSGGATWKGLGAGMLEGAGNVVKGLTSPLNLATMGTLKGASALAETAPMAARGLNLTGRALSAPVAIEGGLTAADPSKSISERAFGVAQMAGGVAGMQETLPIKKPTTNIPHPMGDLTSSELSSLQGELNRVSRAKAAPAETGLARTEPQAVTPELVEDIPQSLKSREQRVAEGEKVVNRDKVDQNGNIWVDNLHAKGFGGYTDPTTVGFIEDTARMTEERAAADAEPGVKEERAAKHKEWTDEATQRNEYEGHFTENGPNTRRLATHELTSEQRAVQDSYKKIRDHSDEYGGWFSEQEEKLPEGEYFQPPPEVKAKYDAEQTALKDEHEANYQAYKASKDIPSEMADTLQIEGGTEGPNASGESAASGEAMARQKGMRDRSEQYVVFDKAGRKRVLIGPEAVDYNPRPGETYGIETPRGIRVLTDNGGNVVGKKFGGPRREYPGFKGGGGNEPPIIDVGATETNPKMAGGQPPSGQPPGSAGSGGGNMPPTGGNVGGGGNIPPTGGGANVPPQAGGPPPLQPPPVLPPNVPPIVRQGLIRRALAFNKEMLTSWDLSAPGRQGKAFMLNKAWWTSLDDMIRAWGSPAAARQISDAIDSHPSGFFRQQRNAQGNPINGTSWAEQQGLHLPLAEEAFNSQTGRLLRRWTGIEKASRAHTAFLNKLRSDQFAAFMESSSAAGRNPQTDLRIPQQFAKFINDATGRGSLNVGSWTLERNVGALNDVFFAPRNLSGQIRTWNAMLNPLRYATAESELRIQALKSLFAVAGSGLAVGELARLAGAQVSSDPTSSDFRKIKIGDTRIDLFGGYQQLPVAAAKLLMGETTSTITGKTNDLTAGKYGQQTRASVAETFFTNRLAPLPSFVWAWMSNREFDGKPFEAKRALFERTLPIVIKDMQELASQDPALAAIMTPTNVLGLTGTQVYTGR